MSKRANPSHCYNSRRKGVIFAVLLILIVVRAATVALAAETQGVIALKSINNLTTAESSPYDGKTIEVSVNGKDTELEFVVETSSDISAVNLEVLTANWGRLLLAPMVYNAEAGNFKLMITLPANIRSGDYYLSLLGNPEDEMIYFTDYNQPAPLTVENSEQIQDIPQVSFTYEPETPEPDGNLYLFFAAQSPYGIASVDYMAYFPSQEWAILPVADYNAETDIWESSLAISDFGLETGDYVIITFGATDRLGNTSQRTNVQQYSIQVKKQE